jgi:hypothetical protein
MAELHRLLGLPDDTDPDDLRAVYERHMSDAVRSSNHSRALALSAAFDALPDSHRGQMYRRLTTTASSSAAHWPTTPAGPLRQRVARSRTAGRRSPRPMRSLGRFLFILLGIAGAVFLIAHFQQQPGTIPHGRQFQPPDETVDTTLIANQLDTRFARNDIACPGGRVEPGSTVICRSTDGATWTVLVDGPPAGFELVNSTPSRDLRAAQQDARQAVATVTRCRALARGGLPPTIAPAITRATFTCGSSTHSVSLHTGSVLDYQRIDSRTYRLTITAANGETVRYSSATGRYTS